VSASGGTRPTTYYVDTSIAVHALTGTKAAQRWFDAVTATGDHALVSSRLLRTELIRALRREGRPVTEGDVILDNIAFMAVSEAVVTTAELIPDHVKTLDAIHAASAALFGSDTVVVTSDANLKRVVTSAGLTCHDPTAAS
jgi:predicted nucleic acid-binding protein